MLCAALAFDADNKVYRSYRGQVERVTDVIRCSIVFTTVDELVRFIEVSLRDSLNFRHLKALPEISSARFSIISFSRKSTSAIVAFPSPSPSKLSGFETD